MFVDRQWELEERQLVLEHIECGMMIRAWMGFSPCRFCGTSNGNLDLTDGVYLWPQGLAHYLKEHDVRLPVEFVEHVLAFDEHVATDADWWLALQHPDWI